MEGSSQSTLLYHSLVAEFLGKILVLTEDMILSFKEVLSVLLCQAPLTPRCFSLMEDNLNEVEIGSSMKRAPNQKRSQDRLWKGLAKDVLRDKKSLHCVLKRNSLSINSDGVLSNKPGDGQKHEENVIFAPLEQQPSMSNVSNRSSQLKLEARSEEPNDKKDDPPNHWGHDLSSLQLHEVSTVQQQNHRRIWWGGRGGSCLP